MADYRERESIKEFDIFDGTFESIKDNLFMRLFNKHNLPLEKSLDSVPHIKYIDLVVTFSIEERTYFNGNRGIYSYMITNEDMKALNVDEETLRKIATENILKKNSARIETLQEHIVRSHIFSPLSGTPNNSSVLMFDIQTPNKSKSKDSNLFNGNEFGQIPFFTNPNNEKDILLISNRTQTFASINIIMPEVLDEVYQEFKENFYIVPTSIHELICIKSSYVTNNGEKTEKHAIEDLKDMVEQINDVIHKDALNILSYNIYYRMPDDNCTMIVT